MTAKAGYSTPMLTVADVERSIAFYELLGFELVDDDGAPGCPIGWARMHCDGGALMFLRAEEPVDTSSEVTLFYLYTSDLPALREHLLANGVAVSPISFPGYMPSGEIQLQDPDGYRLLIAHWAKPQQEDWEKHLEERRR
ncbi:MAG TPA: VOC family protein [Thermoanaerobaculia bacterium]|nr:VOC family protein [Thermoanaerobaculia bacterium]